MVFEGVLAAVINRFLGPYVKNLDASQLNVGIWSGKSRQNVTFMIWGGRMADGWLNVHDKMLLVFFCLYTLSVSDTIFCGLCQPV